MKKINILLIVAILICSLISILCELDKDIVLILKDVTIVLTLTIPYIIEKIFKIDLNDGFKTIWIIFIFMAQYLGVTLGLYNTWEYFDKITHTMSGVITAYIGLLILKFSKIENKKIILLFIISFSGLCAGVWEIFEFTCDSFFGFDAQKVALTGASDTMGDIIVALIGALLFSAYYVLESNKK